MSSYSGDDLNGWEFKIVTSALGRFNSYEAVQKTCREEAENGWELVEKFDNDRLRFKRRVERRANDRLARLDPYRTTPSARLSSKTVALIVGSLLILAAIVAFLLIK